MRISPTLPPQEIYEACVKLFRVSFEDTIFTYGPTIHAKYPEKVTPDIIAHESVHIRQQGGDPAAWWMKYLYDPHFRLAQEIEAYRAQYSFMLKEKTLNPRQTLPNFVHRMAILLSGKMYGNIITYRDAVKKIKENL